MLQALGLVTSDSEMDLQARKEGRPRRRHDALTNAGRPQLSEAGARDRAVGRLFENRSTT